MLILAFDTSALAGSVALLLDDNLLASSNLPEGSRSAQTLAPAIDQLLRGAGRKPTEINLVAATVGPGSFTGLRVGVTTAKTLAYAIGCDVIGLDTLEVIAAQAVPLIPEDLLEAVEIQAVLDAQRGELFVGWFAPGSDQLRRLTPSRIVPAIEWLQALQPSVIATGPGLKKLRDQLPADIVAAPIDVWEPQAITIGRLALAEHRRGRRDDLWKLAPAYLRASAAEEKAAKSLPAK